jgi:hypothetical protein
MTMEKTVKEGWQTGLILLLAPGFVLTFAAGCTPKPAPSADMSDGQSAADADVAAAEPVDPPEAVVAQDPQIPLNEAVVGSAPVAEDFYAASAPPEAVVESPPPSPAPSNVWIPGYWWWSPPLGRYVWVGGAWRNPPPEQTWFPGSWGLVSPGRYGWTPGLWAPRGYQRDAVVINEGPPVLRVEVMGVSPGVDFAWRPGYYNFHSGSYLWVGGSWDRPPVVGLGWVEPRYIGVFGHYTFQPGRWDYSAERRGTVYMPDINVRPGEHFRPVPVPVAVVSAHVGYVSASARAISRGAVRTSSGGYAPPAVGVHGSVGVGVAGHAGGAAEGHGGAEEHGGAAAEVHGGTPEVHGGAADEHGGEHAGGGAEVHGSAEVHGGGAAEVHSGGSAEAHGGSADLHNGTVVHQGPAAPAKPVAPQGKPAVAPGAPKPAAAPAAPKPAAAPAAGKKPKPK